MPDIVVSNYMEHEFDILYKNEPDTLLLEILDGLDKLVVLSGQQQSWYWFIWFDEFNKFVSCLKMEFFKKCVYGNMKKLIHWGWVMHLNASINYNIIGSDNGLSPGRCQAIIWTSAWILLIRPLGTNKKILIEIHTFSQENPFEYVIREMATIFSQPQCVNL